MTAQSHREAVTSRTPFEDEGATNSPLTSDRLVDVALVIIREAGVGGLTMRRLAEDLGVTQMAPYHYIKSKEELVQLSLDRLLGGIAIPPKSAGAWDRRLLLRFSSMIDVFRDYPGMAIHLLSGTLPPSGRRMVRATLAMLLEEGLTPEEALFTYGTVSTWAHGHLSVSARRGSASSTMAYYSMMLEPSRRPTIAFASDDFTFSGLEAVITGVKAKLAKGV